MKITQKMKNRLEPMVYLNSKSYFITQKYLTLYFVPKSGRFRRCLIVRVPMSEETINFLEEVAEKYRPDDVRRVYEVYKRYCWLAEEDEL